MVNVNARGRPLPTLLGGPGFMLNPERRQDVPQLPGPIVQGFFALISLMGFDLFRFAPTIASAGLAD
jgi:hypothetical protein